MFLELSLPPRRRWRVVSDFREVCPEPTGVSFQKQSNKSTSSSLSSQHHCQNDMAGSNGGFLRRVNLVEILEEELEDAGEQLPPELTDGQLQCMTEADIRQHYRQAPGAQAAAQPQQLPQAQAEQLKHRFLPQDGTVLFRSWFPALSASRTQHLAPAQPKAVVLCFHSSGNAEDMYTSEGTGSRCARHNCMQAPVCVCVCACSAGQSSDSSACKNSRISTRLPHNNL